MHLRPPFPSPQELYHYLNVPFLELKVLSLADQLAAAREELGLVREEMAAYLEHHEYAKFLEWMKASKYAHRHCVCVSRRSCSFFFVIT